MSQHVIKKLPPDFTCDKVILYLPPAGALLVLLAITHSDHVGLIAKANRVQFLKKLSLSL